MKHLCTALVGLVLLATPVCAAPHRKAAPRPDPNPYRTMQHRCAAWARRYEPHYDVYSGYEADGQFYIHDIGAPYARFQFNKCMTMNGYPTDIVPDSRHIQ